MTGKQWAELFEAAATGVYKLADADENPEAVSFAELLSTIAGDMRAHPRMRCHVNIDVDWKPSRGGKRRAA